MKSLIPALFTVGALMVLFGAAVYITGWEPAPYVYTIGATMVALAQINSLPRHCSTGSHRFVENPATINVLLQVAGLPDICGVFSKGITETHIGSTAPWATGSPAPDQVRGRCRCG